MNVLDLLPAGEDEDSWVVQQTASSGQGNIILAVLTGATEARTLWAPIIEHQLSDSGVFSQVIRLDGTSALSESAEIWWHDRFALRFPQWLESLTQRGELAEDEVEELAIHAIQDLDEFFADPGSHAFEALVLRDPLLLFVSGLMLWSDTQLAHQLSGQDQHTLFWLEQIESPFRQQARLLFSTNCLPFLIYGLRSRQTCNGTILELPPLRQPTVLPCKWK
ncbi:MAG: hypothetical protein LR015_02685 [Verrucomicrobia bacterium]|nr:hypothetical protein [Verrucomicrobiota bacterium]